MKHIELARKYFETFGKPMIEENFPEIADRYAAGLVGEGSGCFGFDDEISQDHDFGPGFCVWLTDSDFEKYGDSLQQAYDNLPWEFEGFSRDSIIDSSRLGIMKISEFYQSFTGCSDIPSSNMDWFLISESNLAAITNGVVFEDKLGEFSRIRKGFLDFYPHDILLKKLAARAAVSAQSGQYNYGRCIKRGDMVTASLTLSRFTESAMSMIYLLNSKPMPFYKWSYRGLGDIYENASVFEVILAEHCKKDVSCHIEKICMDLIEILYSRKLIRNTDSTFLQDYIPQLMEQIEDPEIRAMHPMADCL